MDQTSFPKTRDERMKFEYSVMVYAMPKNLLSFNAENNGEVYVKYVSETERDVEFILVLRVPKGFPEKGERGRVYVYSPRPLKSVDGRVVGGPHPSYEFHTHVTSEDGLPCVCDGDVFREENTFANLFQKAFIWLEAYLYHRRTGKPISDALPAGGVD